jgi:hypothetical protein
MVRKVTLSPSSMDESGGGGEEGVGGYSLVTKRIDSFN